MDIVQRFSALFSHFQTKANFLDLIIFLITFFYIHEGYFLGFTLAFLDLVSFIISFVAALQFYTTLSQLLTALFAFPIGVSHAVSFFIIAFLSEITLSLVFRKLLHRVPALPHNHKLTNFLSQANHILGIIPGILSAFIILSFLVTILVAFPSSPVIKQAIADSVIASKLVSSTSFFEKQLNAVFGGKLTDTLHFLTVEPTSDKKVLLHFTVTNGKVDAQAEQEMYQLVNKERVANGLSVLQFDSSLRDVARAHSQDMLANGYFSHKSLTGRSPFERMEDAGIHFVYAGENLALAPTTPLAMQGLMNSPGHRANILSPQFYKIGIGVIDGGIFGKMYSQEFSN